MYKVLIADEQYLVRRALGDIIHSTPGMELVGEAEEENELLEILESKPLDIIILDHAQTDSFGEGTVQEIKRQQPAANILIISGDEEPEHIDRVLSLGVSSYLTKSCGEQEIMDAIKATARGDKFFCTRIIDYLLEKSFPQNRPESTSGELSAREIEIVQWIAQGKVAKEIARELNLSTHTIYTHRKNIMSKLKLRSSSDLVMFAMKNGLVPQKDGH